MKDVPDYSNPATRQFLDMLDQELAQIRTREDLSRFVDLLSKGYQRDVFQHLQVSDYLQGTVGILNGLDGLCRNSGRATPEQPDWRWVGEILLCSFYHS
jgi:hypothetical protein